MQAVAGPVVLPVYHRETSAPTQVRIVSSTQSPIAGAEPRSCGAIDHRNFQSPTASCKRHKGSRFKFLIGLRNLVIVCALQSH